MPSFGRFLPRLGPLAEMRAALFSFAGSLLISDFLHEVDGATPELEDLHEASSTQAEGQEATNELWWDLGQWLEAEGIIRMDDGVLGSVSLDDAVLTARGFELLRKPIPGTEKSLGNQLGDLAKSTGKDAANAGAKKVASDLVGSFLGNFVKGFTS
jgi:hypothetical protein